MVEIEVKNASDYQGRKICKDHDQANCDLRTRRWEGKDGKIEKKRDVKSGARVTNHQKDTSRSNWGPKTEFLDRVEANKRKAGIVWIKIKVIRI